MVTVLRTRARALSLEVMSAIFYDLRDACYFPKIVQGKPEKIDWTMYQEMNVCTSNFITEAFAQVGQQLTLNQQNRTGRMYIALERLGWKIFAICAHSKAFRAAIQSVVDNTEWDIILEFIYREKRSIETFARSRDLDWRGPLLPYAGDPWPGLQEALTPDINLATEHPHHIVQTEDGGLRQPVFPWTEDGELQPNMHRNFLHPSFPFQTAVASKRNDNFRECFLCFKKTCKCEPMFVPADFIELREYAGRGVGTRALINFPKGMCLGEFNGVVRPEIPGMGDIWSMIWTVQIRDKDGNLSYDYPNKLVVDPTRLGSWTRYSNHHCDQYNARPVPAVVGDQDFLGFITHENICVFDEVNITYGPEYWGGERVCKCGGVGCVSNPRGGDVSSD